MGAGSRALPAPDDALLPGDASPAFRRGTNDFARFYGMLIDGLQMGYVNGFGYNQVLPAPDAELPERFQRAEQVFAQKTLA